MKNHTDDLEIESKQAFANLRGVQPKPSAFLKGRVLARLEHEGSRKSKSSVELWFWRLAAGCALCAWIAFSLIPTTETESELNQAFAQQSYVIHLDLSGDRLHEAVVAEIELPEGVHFFSKSHPEIAELRQMELPVAPGKEGRSRLPFVVKADSSGTREIKLRFYNADRQLLFERLMSVNFVEKQKS